MRLEELLKSGASQIGAPLGDEKIALFRAYYELLEKRNAEFNLTAIKGEEDAAKLHFLDSLGILSCADFSGRRVIDVGCGAGFPGWPVKIAEPTVSLTLLDSTEKKVAFLREVSETLGLNAECVHARAEELSRMPEYREKYDIAVSRAVARLNVLCELCLPFVKTGGVFIALKAADSDEEIREAYVSIKTLGGAKAEIREYQIPGTEITRRAVIIRKEAPTPAKYARRYAQITKKPL